MRRNYEIKLKLAKMIEKPLTFLVNCAKLVLQYTVIAVYSDSQKLLPKTGTQGCRATYTNVLVWWRDKKQKQNHWLDATLRSVSGREILPLTGPDQPGAAASAVKWGAQSDFLRHGITFCFLRS